jgi:hypothetical protein
MSASGNRSEHGALGSNKPLERVPVDEQEVDSPPADEPFETRTVESKPLKSAGDEDVVYLRDDLRPN